MVVQGYSVVYCLVQHTEACLNLLGLRKRPNSGSG
jgi:hypothetical protein